MAPFIKVRSEAGDERYIRWEQVAQVVDESVHLTVWLANGHSVALAETERKRFLEVLNSMSMQRPAGLK